MSPAVVGGWLQQLLPASWSAAVVVAALFAAAAAYRFATCTHGKWRRLNVPHEPPAPLFGNTCRMTLGLEHQLETFDRAYRRFAGARYCGLYQLRTPFLMVRDPALVNRIMVKDFACFANRGLDFDPAVNLLARSMFFAAGRRWRAVRQKLSPGFTSGKLKGMHGQISMCCGRLMRRLDAERRGGGGGGGGGVDVNAVVSDFTNNVIGACAFGLDLRDADDAAHSDQVFRDNVRKLFGSGGLRQFAVQTFIMVFPGLASLFRVQAFSVEATDFFHAMFTDVIRYRTENGVNRADLTQTLMDARNDLVEAVDRQGGGGGDGGGGGGGGGDDDDSAEYKFTELDIIANAILLFVAGSNTVSATMSFCLYELALNKTIQDRLRAEIYSTKEKYGGQLTPEFLMNLHYADMVLDETHRKYSITIVIPRKANQDYHVPDDTLVIKKGDKILIPMYSLHHDPQYYPNPDTFDPERFTAEEKSKRPSGTFLPFGDGPRHCIGKRFAGMELKLVLSEILLKYEVLPCEKTEVPLQYSITPGFVAAKNGIWLTFKPIDS